MTVIPTDPYELIEWLRVPAFRRTWSDIRLRETVAAEADSGRRVYFYAAGPHVKVGFSTDPERRTRNLRSPAGERGLLLGSIPGWRRTERAVHFRFDPYHVEGEWFNLRQIWADVDYLLATFGDNA